MNKPVKARSSLFSCRTYFTLKSAFHVLPGTERSLALNERGVERSDSGDRVKRGVSTDHLVLPLLPLNVHMPRCRERRTACSRAVPGWCTGGCTGGVHTGGVPGCTNVSFPLFSSSCSAALRLRPSAFGFRDSDADSESGIGNRESESETGTGTGTETGKA